MVVDNKEKVLWNRPNWLPWSQILVNHATLDMCFWCLVAGQCDQFGHFMKVLNDNFSC